MLQDPFCTYGVSGEDSVELGPVAELILRDLPEMAGVVDSIRKGEEEMNVDLGFDTSGLPPYELLGAFREVILEPALGGHDGGVNLKRCCNFMRHVLLLDAKPNGYYEEALALRVMDRLQYVDKQKLVEIEPSLARVAML